SFTFSSRRSIGSSSTLRVAILAIPCSPLSGAMLASERAQDRLDALVDLGVGQCAIGRLERQPDREADGTLRDAFPRVAIEERRRDERRRQLARGGENGA